MSWCQTLRTPFFPILSAAILLVKSHLHYVARAKLGRFGDGKDSGAQQDRAVPASRQAARGRGRQRNSCRRKVRRRSGTPRALPSAVASAVAAASRAAVSRAASREAHVDACDIQGQDLGGAAQQVTQARPRAPQVACGRGTGSPARAACSRQAWHGSSCLAACWSEAPRRRAVAAESHVAGVQPQMLPTCRPPCTNCLVQGCTHNQTRTTDVPSAPFAPPTVHKLLDVRPRLRAQVQAQVAGRRAGQRLRAQLVHGAGAAQVGAPMQHLRRRDRGEGLGS